ncbi:ParA family protein [Paracoccus nototheniae]|uniref:ParA family protein n=1 Tax=Paracoccus nototheniae TaxID=2489002 RepID=A0ABW4DYB2_9RHOB|nr:AAA family ATPase [Paracoccus nototheniae]
MTVIACYSNKGGVGKTAVAVNLAHALAEGGLRVLLCDLDPQGAAGFYVRVKPSSRLQDQVVFDDAKRIAGAIKGSDYDNLDILPATTALRDADLLLSQMKKGRSRLGKSLKAVDGDYDVIVLDCPPGLSALSQTIFHAADLILVPVIPTTLSERTFEQLLQIAGDDKDGAGTAMRKKIAALFSMVQARKSLHGETMARMRDAHPKRFLSATLPFSSDVERMGVHRAPILTFAARRPAAQAFLDLTGEVRAKLGIG